MFVLHCVQRVSCMQAHLYDKLVKALERTPRPTDIVETTVTEDDDVISERKRLMALSPSSASADSSALGGSSESKEQEKEKQAGSAEAETRISIRGLRKVFNGMYRGVVCCCHCIVFCCRLRFLFRFFPDSIE